MDKTFRVLSGIIKSNLCFIIKCLLSHLHDHLQFTKNKSIFLHLIIPFLSKYKFYINPLKIFFTIFFLNFIVCHETIKKPKTYNIYLA